MTHHRTSWVFFFHSLFSHCNSLGIYQGNIFFGGYRWIQRGTILSVKFTAISRWKNSVSIFIFICQFSNNGLRSFSENIIWHNVSLNQNNRFSFIFIGNPKNPINDKISTCPINNIHILFKNNFRNLINQVLTRLF